MGWFRLASHLGIPLQELMERTTSTEFLEWMKYLEMERQDRDKADYYAALIATEVRRSYVKDPRSVDLEDMLLAFKSGEEKKPEGKQQLSGAEEAEKRMSISKAFWFAVTGVKHARD